MTEYKHIIIGGGAAGIALALNLLDGGENNFLLLEKNKILGSSWDNMPDHLTLISSDHHNRILEESSPHSLLYRVPAKEFSKYLQSFEDKLKDKIKYKQNVIDLSKNAHLWNIKTENEVYQTKNVIWATGYYSNPFIPDFITDKSHTIHFKEFKNAQAFSKKKVLVVGKRLSAGQIIKELKSENCDVHISSRSAIEFSPGKIVMNILLAILDPLEKLLLLFNKHLRNTENIKMEASFAKEYFDRKEITIHGDVKEIRGSEVQFIDGSHETFDKIILTTGFKPTPLPNDIGVDYLQLDKNFEHPQHKGLYFLGFGQQYNFRSRFLRGIRKDAKVLAKLLISSN